jgi:DNA polymerase-3 subunit gamma/tau
LEEPPKHAIFILATTEKHKIIPTILSRCQIFDFQRIRVKDIAEHLSTVATKEGVSADAEALHQIAMKADGALRDALSIFDQIVTFAGNTLTYKDVLDNLHILDYEYYFKVINAAEKEDIPTALLILNDIYEKGFDGHHFVVGLAEHYRNLLVCKDAQTASLLEVPDTIKQRYQQQAAEVESVRILRSLQVLSKTDVDFKASKNQRLLIEVALMQLCSLKQEQEKKKA